MENQGELRRPPPPPPLPPQVLGYQGTGLPTNVGRQFSGPVPAWRDGMRLVLPLSGVTAPVCVKCNQPARHRWSRTLYWQNPAWLLTLFLGFLIGAIILLAVRKQAFLLVYLCDEHKKKRGGRVLIGWMSALAAVVLLVLSIVCFNGDTRMVRSMGGYILALSGVTLLFAIIWGIVATPVVSIRLIRDGYAWYSGAGPEYLDTLSTF